MLLPLIDIGVFSLVNVRTQTPVPEALVDLLVFGSPIVGATIAVVGLFTNVRTVSAWLGLFLNVSVGLATVYLAVLAAAWSHVDH